METEETKVFLTELEKLKIEEFNKEKEGLNQLYFRIGELETQLSLLKKESVEKTVHTSQNEQKIITELREKYGQFQLGENFEVIKNGGDN